VLSMSCRLSKLAENNSVNLGAALLGKRGAKQ
jgi:hypothetical protein